MLFKALLALFAVGILAALLSPCLQLRAARLDAARAVTARRHLCLSGVVAAVAAAAASGFSIAGHTGNVMAIAAALIAGGVLVLYAFGSRPRILGVATGIVAGIAWLLMLLFCGMSLIVDNSPVTVALGDGLYCGETAYGFVTGDSGEEVNLYQRYLFIDHTVYHQLHSDIYPNEAPPARLAATLARCQAGFNLARAAGAHPG